MVHNKHGNAHKIKQITLHTIKLKYHTTTTYVHVKDLDYFCG